MPRVPQWAVRHRDEVREYAAVLSGGRWRPATYLGKAWFSRATDMRTRLGASYATAERWCEAANRERDAYLAARSARLTERRKGAQ